MFYFYAALCVKISYYGHGWSLTIENLIVYGDWRSTAVKKQFEVIDLPLQINVAEIFPSIVNECLESTSEKPPLVSFLSQIHIFFHKSTNIVSTRQCEMEKMYLKNFDVLFNIH